MNFKTGLSIISPADVDRIALIAADQGCPVYQISTGNRSGRGVFFDAVQESLPLDPTIHTSRSWDALSDSLWEGINSKNLGCVVIVWTDATAMAEGSPDDFETAISVLTDVARLLSDSNATVGNPTDVCIYVGRHQV